MKYLSSDSWASGSSLSKSAAFLLLGALSYTASAYSQSLSSLSISPSQPTVVIGSTTQLKATANYSNGSSTDVSSSVSWSSSDPKMVNVSSAGKAEGLATGTVSVTASYQGKTATAGISSSIGNITWSGPITITKGGTYSGNWKSTSQSTSAVTISTTEPVTIENSYVTGPGDLINDPTHSNDLTVKNTIGVGVNPNVSGKGWGLFVDAQNPIQLTVANCYFENVRFGVYVRGYAGNRNGTQTITIVNNRGRNMLGTESNGSNGTLAGETHWVWSHAFQIGNAPGLPNMKIAWNEIVNYPSKSLVNENINMFVAGGTSSSPTVIADNYIQGAYAYNPAVDNYNGGGITTDGTGSDTVANSSSYINIYNNQIVDGVNVGISLGNGHNNSAYNNRVISAGLLPNGTKIPAQNVGLGIYDAYGNASNGSFYGNNMNNNTVGWACWASRCAPKYRNDEYFPSNTADYSTNQQISTNPITLAMESAEFETWLSKLSSNGITVGPEVSSSSSGGSGSGGSGSGGSSGGGSTSGISTTAWYTVVNTNSTLCLGAAGGSTAAGAALQQNTCGSAASQQWQFKPAANAGYYQVVNRGDANAGSTNVWNVTGGAWQTADAAPIQIYTSKVETNEEWMPVSLGNGDYKFVVLNSMKCLDVPGASSTVLLQMQQYTCNGSGAQSFTLHQQ